MLENYKLHHPSNASNDNTRTMQKQLSNKFQAGMAKSAFFLCTHKMQIVVGCKRSDNYHGNLRNVFTVLKVIFIFV